MKRLTTRVQTDTCDTCSALVITSNWDDLEAIHADTIADPTPLTDTEQVACIVTGRRLYNLEQTIAHTFRLSNRNGYNHDRPLPQLVAIVPAHHCGNRHPGTLPVDVAIALTGGTTTALPDQPEWSAA